MRIHLIFNPNSGHGKARRLYPKIFEILKSRRWKIIPHQTLYRFHASEIVKSLNLYDTDAIVIIGGDGTAFEVLNGLMNNYDKKMPPVAIFPVGTGNSFVKDLNIWTVEDTLAALDAGTYRPVDVISFATNGSNYYFVNNLGLGFVADVSVSAEPIKKWGLGQTAYAISVIKETARLRPHHLRMTIDGKVIDQDAMFVYFCNSVWVAGNMKISPESVFDDGLMEIVMLDPLNRRELLKAFPRVFKGTHLTHPKVRMYRGKEVTITTEPVKFCNPEGEIFGVTPLTLKLLPQTIRYFYKDTE